MDTFLTCSEINDLLNSGDEVSARDKTILMLDSLRQEGELYSPLVNSIIRSVGLYPYLDKETCDWPDRYAIEAFSADVGGGEQGILHREQSKLLGRLMAGRDVAVSAPTSFGKSFVIDAFIAIKQPNSIMILVPTIALMDETRRRIQRKFGEQYKIITSSDQELADRTIFIFPQERALGYVEKVERLDLLVVDEFYKAGRVGKSYDGERSSALIQAVVALSPKCSQRYFLIPNVSEMKGADIFGGDVEFMEIDFNTVFLRKHDLHAQIGKDDGKRGEALLRILSSTIGKSLVYAGTYTNIEKISLLAIEHLPEQDKELLKRFSDWLSKNYTPTWELVNLAKRGIGVHNGSLHRSLAQIQVMLFEKSDGLDVMVSTSSIIEGVNTSAENVILWSNKSGRPRIDDFTYKNIIGRGGRMFFHFIGNIYILDRPPEEEGRQLEFEIPEEMLGTIDESNTTIDLSSDQIAKIAAYREEMDDLLGPGNYDYFTRQKAFKTCNSTVILGIAQEMAEGSFWGDLVMLNGNDVTKWDNVLYRLIKLRPGDWGRYGRFVEFVKVLAGNWNRDVSDMLDELDEHDIGINAFFSLERKVCFNLSSLIADAGLIYNRIHQQSPIDLSVALMKFSHSFLPKNVYLLEEYGLPRMLSKKIHNSGVVNLADNDRDILEVISEVKEMGHTAICENTEGLDYFDELVIEWFLSGV